MPKGEGFSAKPLGKSPSAVVWPARSVKWNAIKNVYLGLCIAVAFLKMLSTVESQTLIYVTLTRFRPFFSHRINGPSVKHFIQY